MSAPGIAGRALVLLVAGTIAPATPSCGEDPTPAAATIRGIVRFEGTRPRIIVEPLWGLDPCGQKGFAKAKAVAEQAGINDDGTLRDVFVRATGAREASRAESPAEPARLSVRNCFFEPRVLGIRAGQRLVVRSEDTTPHAVHGSARANPVLSFGLSGAGEERTITFASEETIPVKCDRHGWEEAWIHVVAHPYFDVTRDGGTFEIGDLPPGAHTIEAWHERYGRQERLVTLAPSAMETVEFVFRADEAKK